MPEVVYQRALYESVRKLADMAFAEDMPDGDLTRHCLHINNQYCVAELITRERVQMCAHAWIKALLESFEEYVDELRFDLIFHVQDGKQCEAGECLLTLKGSSAHILAFERVLLNFIARAIGIASYTSQCVQIVADSGLEIQIFDTRKTLPGYRYFDKYAVLCGGGFNHRMSLSDQVLIKENHLFELGDIKEAEKAQKWNGQAIENCIVEVQNSRQLKQAIDARFGVIMLDNFSIEAVRGACLLPHPNSQFEVSGGIQLENLNDYMIDGLQRISIGALTHSFTTPDLSLLIRG